jgi:HK97 family phage major capsid protein
VSDQIIEALDPISAIRQAGVPIIPMTSDTLTLPVDRTSMTVYYTQQNPSSDSTASDMDLDFRTLVCKEAVVRTVVPNSFLEDISPASDAYLRNRLAVAIATEQDRATFVGTGAGQPLGLMYNSGVDGNKITGINESALTHDTIVDLLLQIQVGNAIPDCFFGHPYLRGALEKLTDTINQPIFKEVLGTSAIRTLKGLPMHVSTNIVTATPTYPLFVAQKDHILFGQRTSGIAIDASDQEYFSRNQTVIKAVVRFDVNVGQPEAVSFCEITHGA